MAEPLSHRWYLAGDGSVLQWYVDERGREKYVRFPTSRPVALDDLHRLDRDLDQFQSRGDRFSRVFLLLTAAGVLGVVVAVVLPWIGIDVGGWLLGLAVPTFAVGFLGVTVAPRGMRRRFDALHHRAGLESAVPHAIRSDVAQRLIDSAGDGPEPTEPDTPGS